MKFEKITRAASEFIILSILMEKNNSHPYEIHQILQDRIEQHQQYQLDSLQTLIKYGEVLNVACTYSQPLKPCLHHMYFPILSIS